MRRKSPANSSEKCKMELISKLQERVKIRGKDHAALANIQRTLVLRKLLLARKEAKARLKESALMALIERCRVTSSKWSMNSL